MPTPVFAVAAGSSLTGFNNAGQAFRICIADTSVNRQNPSQDVTQQGDIDTYAVDVTNPAPPTTVTAAVYRGTKRHVMQISGYGFYQTSSDGGTTWNYQYAAPGGAGGVTGAVQGRVTRAVIERRMGLLNVTAANDQLPKTLFTFTKVSYVGSMFGYLQATETPLDLDTSAPLAVSFPFGTGAVTGNASIDSLSQGIQFNRGGPHSLSTPFRLTGPVGTTSTPFDILAFDAVLNLGNGQTMTGDAILASLRCDLNYEESGVIPFRFSGVISDFAFS
jgi:hypothetical protein